MTTENSSHERAFLIRCLVGFVTTGLIVVVADLAFCRAMTPSAACDPQQSAVQTAVGAATGWVGGILTKSPEH